MWLTGFFQIIGLSHLLGWIFAPLLFFCVVLCFSLSVCNYQNQWPHSCVLSTGHTDLSVLLLHLQYNKLFARMMCASILLLFPSFPLPYFLFSFSSQQAKVPSVWHYICSMFPNVKREVPYHSCLVKLWVSVKCLKTVAQPRSDELPSLPGLQLAPANTASN